jgi:hypothetical protein
LDGIVFSTVQNIKAAVGAIEQNRQYDENGESESERPADGIGKKKKEKIGTMTMAIHRRRTSSSGGNSSTNIPAQIVPQYPFEVILRDEIRGI